MTSPTPKVVNRAPSGQVSYSSHDRKGSRSKRGLPPDFENNLESTPNSKSSEYTNGRVLSSEMVDESQASHAADYETSYQKHNSRGRGRSRDHSSGRDETDRHRSEVKDLDRDEISSTTTEESNAESEYSEKSNKQVRIC